VPSALSSLLRRTAWIGSQRRLRASASQPSFECTTFKYGERGRRFVHLEAEHCLEAGHSAENVMLQAVALDLATTMVGAFNDDEWARFGTQREYNSALSCSRGKTLAHEEGVTS
jgi:hypothetical protein